MGFWNMAKTVGKDVAKGGKWAIEHRKDIADVAQTGADLIRKVTAGKKPKTPAARDELPIIDGETAAPADPLLALEAKLAITARDVAGLREDTDQRLRELHQKLTQLRLTQSLNEKKAEARFKFQCVAGGLGILLVIILTIVLQKTAVRWAAVFYV